MTEYREGAFCPPSPLHPWGAPKRPIVNRIKHTIIFDSAGYFKRLYTFFPFDKSNVIWLVVICMFSVYFPDRAIKTRYYLFTWNFINTSMCVCSNNYREKSNWKNMRAHITIKFYNENTWQNNTIDLLYLNA